jgi:hypothetical protein
MKYENFEKRLKTNANIKIVSVMNIWDFLMDFQKCYRTFNQIFWGNENLYLFKHNEICDISSKKWGITFWWNNVFENNKNVFMNKDVMHKTIQMMKITITKKDCWKQNVKIQITDCKLKSHNFIFDSDDSLNENKQFHSLLHYNILVFHHLNNF